MNDENPSPARSLDGEVTSSLLAPLIFVVVGCVALGIPISASAQLRSSVEAHFDLGVPVGAFRDRNRWVAPGGRFGGAIGYGDVPLLVGAEIAFMWLGAQTASARTASPELEYRISARSTALFGHLFARLQSARGTFRPYVDAQIGMKGITGVAEFDSENASSGEIETYEPQNVAFRPALSYGFGVGLDLLLWPRSTSSEGTVAFDGMVTIGVRALLGGESEFVASRSLRVRPDGTVTVDVLRSSTSMIVPHLGVKGQF